MQNSKIKSKSQKWEEVLEKYGLDAVVFLFVIFLLGAGFLMLQKSNDKETPVSVEQSADE